MSVLDFFDSECWNLFWQKKVVKLHIKKTELLTVYLLVSSADIFCKQFGTRSGPTKLFDTLMVFWNEFFKKVNFEKEIQQNSKTFKITQ